MLWARMVYRRGHARGACANKGGQRRLQWAGFYRLFFWPPPERVVAWRAWLLLQLVAMGARWPAVGPHFFLIRGNPPESTRGPCLCDTSCCFPFPGSGWLYWRHNSQGRHAGPFLGGFRCHSAIALVLFLPLWLCQRGSIFNRATKFPRLFQGL